MKHSVAAVAAVAVLLLAPGAYGWSWGYNYVGATVNTRVDSGWNYWVNQYLDKNSGGYITHGFVTQSGGSCWDFMYGAETHFHSPQDLGCGGYIRNFVEYFSGNTSYLYVSSAS